MSSFRAVLAMDCLTWYVFVHPTGPWPDRCPEYRWGDGEPIPTPAQRRTGLTALGYQPAAGAGWEWTEVNPDPEGDLPVALLAAIDVHPLGVTS